MRSRPSLRRADFESIIRKHHDVRITGEDVDVLRQRRLDQVDDPGMRREVRRSYNDLPTGGLMPAFGWPGWAWGAIRVNPTRIFLSVR